MTDQKLILFPVPVSELQMMLVEVVNSSMIYGKLAKTLDAEQKIRERFISVEKVAEMLDISERQVYNLTKQNKFPVYYINSSPRYKESEVIAYVESTKYISQT